MSRPKRRKPRRQFPICSALLTDGFTRCKTVVETEESPYCAFHNAHPDKRGEPFVAAEPEQSPEPEQPPVDEGPTKPTNGAPRRKVLPDAIRATLAEDLGSEYDVFIRTLQAAMSEAEKDHWVTCRQCQNKTVYIGPDHKTRLDAAAKWMELSIGRKREDPKPAPELPDGYAEEGSAERYLAEVERTRKRLASGEALDAETRHHLLAVKAEIESLLAEYSLAGSSRNP
jgi:hypothetical protein